MGTVNTAPTLSPTSFAAEWPAAPKCDYHSLLLLGPQRRVASLEPLGRALDRLTRAKSTVVAEQAFRSMRFAERKERF